MLGGKPFFNLPINETVEQRCVQWDNFGLPSGMEALKMWDSELEYKIAKYLVTIRFIMQSSTDVENEFNIMSIGTLYDKRIFLDRE